MKKGFRFRRRHARHRRWYFGLLIYAIFVSLTTLLFRGPSPSYQETPLIASVPNLVGELQYLLGEMQARHPAGSSENDEVRTRLVHRLQELGLEVELHSFTLDEKILTNVLAHRPGKKTPRPLLFTSHYDSCQFGPGAGDAMSAVAALLESIRVMQANRIDLECWFLFTDGEELGLKGASQFVTATPWKVERPPLVFNWDARGTEGSVLMFETHAKNYGLVRQLIGRLAFPRFTNSLMVGVYQRLPNGTDFSVWKKKEAIGFNFAMIDGAHRYHTPADTVENVSHRALQHYGNHAQQLLFAISRWSDREWQAVEADTPAVFFDILGGPIMVYPEYWNGFLTLIAWLGVALVARKYHRQSSLRTRPLAVVWTAVLLLLVAGVAFDWGLATLLTRFKVLPARFFAGSGLVAWLYALPPFLLCVTCVDYVLERRHVLYVRLAVWIWMAILASFTTLLAPGAAFLFHWPLFLSLGLGLLGHQSRSSDYWSLFGFSLLYVPLLVLFLIAMGPSDGIALGFGFSLLLLPTLPLLAEPFVVQPVVSLENDTNLALESNP